MILDIDETAAALRTLRSLREKVENPIIANCLDDAIESIEHLTGTGAALAVELD